MGHHKLGCHRPRKRMIQSPPAPKHGDDRMPAFAGHDDRETGAIRADHALMSANNKWIGQSVERLEDPPLVRGRGCFAADISFPHQLHMRIVRSNHAHGRIVAVDTAAARALPGVVAVWTAAEIADVPPVDFREGRIPALEPYRQPVLASGKVRYVGDPVAAVFAESPYVAEDAADLVTMEIEELPPLLAAEAEPGEFSPGRNTEVAIIRQGYGDVDAALRDAPMVVELELAIGRHSGVPLEARGAIGRYDAARDILELHGAAKVPHRNRELLSRMLGAAAVVDPRARVACGRRLRHPRRALSRGRAGLRRRHAAQPPGEVDRGPARAPDRRQSFAPAVAPHPRRGRPRRPHPGDRRPLFPRPGRLCAHPRGARRAHDGGDPARPLPGAGLSGGRPFPPHQQDAGGDLPRARPLRDHVRPRTAGRRDRAEARPRSQRRAAPQRHLQGRDALSPAARGAGRGDRAQLRRLRRAARQAARRARLGQAQGRARAPPRRRRAGRRRICDVRREERARPRRRRAHRGRHRGRGRADHRRRLARPGLRDRDGAGLRRDAERRLPARARHPRPDRPHRIRDRRACLARHRDDGVRHAQRGGEAARQGDRGGGRADAGAARRARPASTARWCARIAPQGHR